MNNQNYHYRNCGKSGISQFGYQNFEPRKYKDALNFSAETQGRILFTTLRL